MRTGNVRYNNTTLDHLGNPTISIQRSRQPASSERPSFYDARITVSVEIDSLSPSTSRAKVEAIKEALDTEEGELTLGDENGTEKSWIAKPMSDNIGEIFKMGYGTMEITFQANEPVNNTESISDAIFTPSNGDAAINIHHVHDWKITIRPNRKDERVGTHQSTTTTVSFQGRTKWADTNLDYEAREAWLDAEIQKLRGMDTKEGVMVRGSFNETVQVENMTFKVGGNAEFIAMEVQCRNTSLPDDTIAEATYTVSDDIDWMTSKWTRKLQGTIEASTETIARAKFDALATAYQTSGYRRRKQNLKPAYLDGADEALDTPEFTQFIFSLEYDQIFWLTFKLNIDTDESPSGNRMTYSGSTLSADLTAALDKAREIGNDLTTPHPVQISSKETIKITSDINTFGDGDPPNPSASNDTEFKEVTFSYTYAVASTVLKATITQQISKPAFGDYTTSVSGEMTAPTEQEALDAAREYIPEETCLRENSESSSTVLHDEDELWTKINFNYGWRAVHTETTLKYTDSLTTDYATMTGMRTYSGTARAVDKDTAVAAAAGIMEDPLPNDGILKGKDIKASLEQCPDTPESEDFIQVDFTFTIEENLVGLPAHDIIEAEYSIERIGQVPHDPITEIPCGPPVKQTMVGSLTTGQITVNGTCKARVEATAKAWGQSKQTIAVDHGTVGEGAKMAPRERIKANFRAFEAATPQTYTFSFTYAAKYIGGLEGLYPSTGSLILTPSP